MDIKLTIVIWLVVLLLSGCRSTQDRSVQDDDTNVHVSGDVTISAIGRSGGIYEK